MKNTIIDFSPSKKCVNPQVWFTCYKCNACGRFDKSTMWQDRYEVYTDCLAECFDKLKDKGFQTELQQTNILTDIAYFANKAKTCVKHIEWGKEKETMEDVEVEE